MEKSLNNIFSEFEGKKEDLIPLLQATQARLGYLPKDALLKIARFIYMLESRVYAGATFYTQFRLIYQFHSASMTGRVEGLNILRRNDCVEINPLDTKICAVAVQKKKALADI